MEKQLQRYETYARGIKRLLLLAGLWPGCPSSKLLQFVVATQFIVTAITACGIMHFILSHITNLDLVTKGLGIAVGFWTVLFKLVVFTIYRGSLFELHETLEKSFRKDLENPEYQSVLLSPIAHFDRPTLYLTMSTLSVIVMFNTNPIISIVTQLTHENEVFKHRTPFPSTYPFPESIGLYVTRYIIEIGASYVVATITAATDALFGFYIFQIGTQLRVLSHRVGNLTSTVDYHKIIKECVSQRRILAACRDKLETIYGPIILWMLTSNAMTMCTNIFQASQMSMDKALLVLIYIAMKLMQTLLYGWFGLFLITQSEALRDSVYFCDWPGCSDKLFLSNINTMLLCRPLALKACHFYEISIDMFMTIINTTLSYFFLLRTLDDK